MAYLILSILFSTAIAVVFKLYPRYKVDLFPAIVVNYFVCFLSGVVFVDAQDPISALGAPWLKMSAILGMIFIVGFNMVGLTVQYFGLALATLMQKMSIILSVAFAILYFSESMTALKSMGLFLAFSSILLFNHKADRHLGHHLWIPVMAWLISGLIEILLLYTQKSGLSTFESDASFSSNIFLFAGIFGFTWAVISGQVNAVFQKKNMMAGLLLGVPNFFSIYFLVRLLSQWEGSIALPINNIGILALTAILGIAVFKEKYSRLQWMGLLLAIVAILILSSAL